jgi:hypothetical protein
LIVNLTIDEKQYKTGIKTSKKDLKNCNITRNDFHGDWNYIIAPN